MTRDEIISKHPLRAYLEREFGMQFRQQGAEFYATCPFHSDGKRPNFRIRQSENLWYCDVCGKGGSIIDFLIQKGMPFREVWQKLGVETEVELPKPAKHAAAKRFVIAYDYKDRFGRMVYQVVRYHIDNPDKPCGYDKTFIQRRPDGKGGWIANMEGVERVLYKLPEILARADEEVYIVEGEKDANTLERLGFLATCNVGGAGKWMDGYSEALKGREVVIWPDNDDPGQKHADKVLKSLSDAAKSCRLCKVPMPYKDMTEWVEGQPGDQEAAAAILGTVAGCPKLFGGIELPIQTMAELEQEYLHLAKQSQTEILRLSNWLPSLALSLRGILPGEVVVVLADTGVGKTCLLFNLAIHAAPLSTLLFELELPGTLTFERFAAAAVATSCHTIEEVYGRGYSAEWRQTSKLNHIHVCARSGLTCEQMEKIIQRSELKIGVKPVLVLVDYIGLVAGGGRSRYERISDTAEQLKVLAKRTNTIIVCACQIHRKDGDTGAEVSLHDAKDSGSIENSAGLLLGAWRDEQDSSLLYLKILKNTKGRPGRVVKCNFNGETMVITERMKDAGDEREVGARRTGGNDHDDD